MAFGEDKKETRLTRWWRGRTSQETAAALSSAEGRADPWQSWSLAVPVPVGAGPWRPVRVSGVKMSRHRPLNRRQVGRAGHPFRRLMDATLHQGRLREGGGEGAASACLSWSAHHS